MVIKQPMIITTFCKLSMFCYETPINPTILLGWLTKKTIFKSSAIATAKRLHIAT